MATRKYQQDSEYFLAQAGRELAAGDLPQASEKGWGAAAQILDAVAKQRGWEHNRHRHYLRITGRQPILKMLSLGVLPKNSQSCPKTAQKPRVFGQGRSLLILSTDPSGANNQFI